MNGTEQIAELTQEVTDAEGIIDSATAFVNGTAQAIADAVAAALANGATQEQLQPLTDLGEAMKVKADALAAALQANPR
jgi:hypothetical protein